MTGAKGRRGKLGKPGRKGLKGLRGPLHKDDLLDHVVMHFDELYRQLDGYGKRIAQLQQQLDRLSDPVGKRSWRDVTAPDTVRR